MRKTYGFFHPYCNAGGGGERVLWQAVKDTLITDKNGQIIIYTGDTDVAKRDILNNALDKFDIEIDESRVELVYLNRRYLVDSKTWPVLTLIGQAVGSMLLAFEAIVKFQPDVWIDTMGYPFSYPVVWLLLNVPIVTYTHFPVISQDMLNKLRFRGLKESLKFIYWSIFMGIYSLIGNFVDIGITNSTWTYNHVRSIWKYNKSIKIIYPPCSTENLIKASDSNKSKRSNNIVVLAQFRPEKRHILIIEEYAKYLSEKPKSPIKLILIGSIRNKTDEEYVDSLKLLSKSLKIPESNIQFILNAPFSRVIEILNSSTYGLNAMWNEHFGIAVVEYMANGLIPIVHASAGPLFDIVVPWDSKAGKQMEKEDYLTRTGFFFKSETDPDHKKEDGDKFGSLSDVLTKLDELDQQEMTEIVKRGRELVLSKFADATFDAAWFDVVDEMGLLLEAKEKQILSARNVLFISILFLLSSLIISHSNN